MSHIPGPDDGLPEIDDTAAVPAGLEQKLAGGATPGCHHHRLTRRCYICEPNDPIALAPIGSRYIGEMRDVPQEPFIYDDARFGGGSAVEHFRIMGSCVFTPSHFDVAMSHDAGSIAEQPASITHRREAWDALGQMRQDEIRQRVGELLTEYRFGASVGAERQIERILEAVLDA